MSKPTWYYAKNRQKAGPVSLDSLKKKLSLGELGSDALVWTVGWESWKKVSDVPELTIPEPPPLPPEEPPSLPVEKPPIVKESDQGKEGSSEKCAEAPNDDPPLPYAVSIHGERPENYVLLTTDKQWLELLTKCNATDIPGREVDRDIRISNIRNHLLLQARYGLVVEPAEEGTDRLKRFFGGRRMLDFRVEKKPSSPKLSFFLSESSLKPPPTSSEMVRATAAQTGRNKVSTTKGISILIIMVGLLLPVVSLGFVEGYNPVLGFVGSIPRMRVVFVEEETEDANRFSRLRPRVTVEEQAISYGYFFALGCILVCLGTAGVLFNQQSNIPKEQAKNEGQSSPPETATHT